MAVPKYDQMYKPFLECLKDGKTHRMPELCKSIAKQMNLSAADTLECRGTNRSPLLQCRIRWTKTYLTKAGLVETVQRGVYQITDEGKKVLEERPDPLDNAFLMRYPDFREFVRPSAKSQKQEKPQDSFDDDIQDDTPDSVVDRAVSQLNSALADDILSAILSKPAGFFEWLVIQLLEKWDMVHQNWKMISAVTNRATMGLMALSAKIVWVLIKFIFRQSVGTIPPWADRRFRSFMALCLWV